MRGAGARWAPLAVIAIAASCARSGKAQEPMPADPGDVEVVIQSTVLPARVDLFLPGDSVRRDVPFAVCDAPCSVPVPPGVYKLYIHETPESLDGARRVKLYRPTTLYVDPDPAGQRSTGLTVAIAGHVAAIAGIVMLIVAASSADRDGHVTEPGLVPAGLVLTLGGLVAIPVGWVMFGRSFSPSVRSEPLESAATARSRTAELRWPSLSFGGKF